MTAFKIRYHVDDGYVGKDRPKEFTVMPYDVADYDDGELADLYEELIQEDFETNVHPEGENLDEFIDWAKSTRDKA